MPEYLSDAWRIYSVLRERNADRSADRRAAGNKTGAGSPTVEHKSLNRAVVVAAVGALEAFCEDLALRACDNVPDAQVVKGWYAIEGTKGMVQTPSSSNIAKMFWVYFRYDARVDWDFALRASWAEAGNAPGATKWRGATVRYARGDAASALDAMVKVRHGFAHQDKSNAPKSLPGVVELTPSGKLSLQSHHAFNAMSMVVQLAVQTSMGLSELIPGTYRSLRWHASMGRAGWDDLLADTPALEAIRTHWTRHPF